MKNIWQANRYTPTWDVASCFANLYENSRTLAIRNINKNVPMVPVFMIDERKKLCGCKILNTFESNLSFSADHSLHDM